MDMATGQDQSPTQTTPPGQGDMSAPSGDMSSTPTDMASMPGDMGQPPGPSEPPHPNTLDQDKLFMCDGSAGSSPARIRRVESFEWAQSIRHSAGNLVPFLPGTSHPYSTYSDGETIDSSILQEYLRQNHNPAGSWKVHSGNGHPRLVNLRGEGSLAGTVRCFQWNWNDQPVEEDPSDECIQTFVTALLEHGVYFRPATPGEVDQLVAFTKEQLVKEKANPEIDRRDTIDVVVRAAWMTSPAIFRSEIGGEPGPDGRRKLTDWELAKSLSLALGDSATGLSKSGYGNDSIVHKVMLHDVQQAAIDGTISDPEVIATLTRRYLSGTDPATMYPDDQASDYPPGSSGFIDEYWMSPKLERFFQEWLGYADAASVFKDTPAATSRFETKDRFLPHHPDGNALNYRHTRYVDNAYKSANLAGFLDNTIARVVAADTKVLETLLTTRRYLLPSASNANPYSAIVYDIDVYESGEIPDDLPSRWVELPEEQRAGVLTHPAWLAAHGGNFENDPSAIHRGKWVYEEMLCGLIPPVPITVDAMLSPETKGDSARSRLVSQLDNNPECSGCHSIMNPLGYAFETYNHAGFFRAEDHGNPPDGSATLTVFPSSDPVLMTGMEVDDAVDMMSYFSRSPRVKRCFVRQTFRYFMGRNETYADACTLQQMEQAYDDSDGSMTEMLIALFQSDAFLYRHIPEEEVEQ
jgi:hypothetical protein